MTVLSRPVGPLTPVRGAQCVPPQQWYKSERSLQASLRSHTGQIEPSQPRSTTVARAAVLEKATKQSVDWDQLSQELTAAGSPLQTVDKALQLFGDEVAIAFSGAEDVALVEYAHLTGRPYRVFSLDTGRLNPETYRLFQAVEDHYKICIEYTFPDAQETMDLVRAKGMFSFYQDGHGECCRIRKVRPLRRQLKTLKAWITGQRKDQSPGTRTGVPLVQVDPVFEGSDGGPDSLVKFNPLSDVSSAEVWNFLRVMISLHRRPDERVVQGVPVNEMHSKGFVSIGCEPCTIPILPNQHEREGRWAWEDATKKECGLHSGNVAGAGSNGAEARTAERDLWHDAIVEPLSRQQLESLADGPRDKNTLVVLYAPWCPFSQAMELAYEQVAKDVAGPTLRVAKFQADIEREFSEQRFGLQSFPTISFLPKGSTQVIKYPSERRDPHTLELWLKSMAGAALQH